MLTVVDHSFHGYRGLARAVWSYDLKEVLNTGAAFKGSVNLLSPYSDLGQISQCSIKGLSVREVMRIEKMII